LFSSEFPGEYSMTLPPDETVDCLKWAEVV
jgi:hypothetical protein